MMQTYIIIYIMDISALLFLFVLLRVDNLMGARRSRAFSYGIIFTIVVILSEFGTILASEGSAEFRTFNVFCNVVGFAITPTITMVLIAIFDTKILRTKKVLLLPTILNTIAVLLSPWLGLIFYVDANNHYQRGIFFFFFVSVYIINIILFVGIIWYTGQKNLYTIKWKIASLSLFIVVGSCIQLLVPSVYSSWHCVTLSLLLLYILLSEFEGSFDALTELYNRAAFEKATKRLKGKKMFSVVVMDINNFKEINDTYGHDYGDTVLKEVSAIIRDSFDNNCNCYRTGGDEFCVIRRDANQEKLERLLKHMTNSLTKIRESDRCLPTVAYGYSVFNGDEPLDFQKMMKEADEQMYYHKKLQKKNNFEPDNKQDC